MRSFATRHLATLLVVAALALVGCAPAPLYKPTPATASVMPDQVVQAGDRYRNAEVIWGGRIINVQNLADHSEIEVLAYPLDSSQRPKINDKGNGRFIAVLPGFVEPMNYPPGTLITVSGHIHGVRDGSVGDAAYRFTVVDVQQHHAWTAQEMRSGHPNISFGVGVGIH